MRSRLRRATGLATPKIFGDAHEGETLEAPASVVSPQWTRDGVDIDGATARSFEVTGETPGAIIGVRDRSPVAVKTVPMPPQPALVAAIVGQSENDVGLFINRGYYTQGPYPAALSGVDARVAIQADSEKSDANTIRTINLSTLSNRDVSPGFVALANLWHVGSGGRPLRLVDVSVPGTSANGLLDVEDTDRDTAADISIIADAQTAFGPVERVVYHWWNSEATASADLIASRMPHLTARNPDGSPYTFPQPGIDYALIDTTGGDKGLFPNDAKLDVMLPGAVVRTAVDLYDPPQPNYRYDNTGVRLNGMVNQNGSPSIQARKDLIDAVPVANRGMATLTSSVALFGDYEGGVRKELPAQTSIHPAMQSEDGQMLVGMHVAASLLMSEGYLNPVRHLRTEVAPDGAYADLVFHMANGGDLTTMRQRRGLPEPATPRPHQQLDGMGIVIHRDGDTEATARPLYRADNTDDTLYPTAYRGTVEIVDTGSDNGGTREARLRVTPVVPFTTNDAVEFGGDGGYGQFILHGWPDYDAQMYLDALIETVPALLPAGYDGIPVEPQVWANMSDVPQVGGGGGGSGEFFTMAADGPVFVAPDNIPDNPTAVRHRATFRVPSDLTPSNSSGMLLAMQSTAFDISLIYNGGKTELQINKIEDSTGAVVTPADTLILEGSRDTWITLDITADHAANEVSFSINDGPVTTRAMTGATSGIFPSFRKISYLGLTSGASVMTAGVEIQEISTWVTAGGETTLFNEVSGNAATVNAHPWKTRDDAV